MSDAEVEAFINVPNPHASGSFRWRRWEMFNVFWAICAYHGCRMGEAASLRKIPLEEEQGHVDFGRDMIIFDGKTGPREVPLSFVVREKLKTYIETQVANIYLFPSVHNPKCPHIKDNAWQDDFNKRIKLLTLQFPDLPNRFHLEPYSVRHSAGTRWADEDWSLFKIQEALGHKKITTTQKYVHMSKKAVRTMIDNDRIALPHKKGEEIIEYYREMLYKDEKKFKDKLFIDVQKVGEDGKEIIVKIKVRE